MAKKKTGSKLPSGKVRVQVLDYVDADGKRHYQSFTAETKTKAQALANEWKYNRRTQKERMSLHDAVIKYIELKRPVLSPSTLKGYESMARNLDKYPISRISIRDLANPDLQTFVSDISIGHSTKYVKNFFGLISATLSVYAPDFTPRVKFAAAKHTDQYTPSSDDVQLLLDSCDTLEAKIGILFGAVCFMRRGEACAVTFKDVDYKKKTIAITKTMVSDPDNLWVIKEPKTYESYRTIMVSDDILSMIKALKRKEGTILHMNPSQLYKAFSKALKKAELPHFRYHDLRHHAASYAHSMGISDRYTEAMGGWKPNSPVMRRVYENVIDIEMVRAQEKYLAKQKYNI